MNQAPILRIEESPGFRRFINELILDLRQGRQVIGLFPPEISPDSIRLLLGDQLERYDYRWASIAVNESALDERPVDVLTRGLDWRWPKTPTPRMLENVPLCTGLDRYQIVFLEGVGAIDETRRQQWLEWIRRWAVMAQDHDGARGDLPIFCMLIPASAAVVSLPEANVKLAVHWWWGRISTLEVRLLCRLSETGSTSETVWREYLLPSLVGTDILLAARLWSIIIKDFDSLMRALRDYAFERSWTPETLRNWFTNGAGAGDGTHPYADASAPPLAARLAAAYGSLYWTAEYGLEIHPAALVLLGREREIRHRLWRAQAALLLPWVDMLRLQACEELTGRFGPDWPTKWKKPEDEAELRAVLEDPMACQLGHLGQVLRSCPNRELRSRWLPHLDRLRPLRNDLAHYRPIHFRDFDRVWRSRSQEIH